MEVIGFSAKMGCNGQSVLADDGATSGLDEMFLKADDWKVNLLATMVRLSKAWAKRADEGIKSADDMPLCSITSLSIRMC